MSSFWYLVAGYSLAWIAVFVYIWSLSRRAAELRRRIDELERRAASD